MACLPLQFRAVDFTSLRLYGRPSYTHTRLDLQSLMPQRTRHQDLDFEIHVDPSCLSEPLDEKPSTMEHEDVVGVKEQAAEEQDSHGNAGGDDSIPDTETLKESVEKAETDEAPAEGSVPDTQDLQPTVEEVADEPEEESTTHGNVCDAEDGTESRRSSAMSNGEALDGDIKRWPSKRTEALIQAAARDIVNHVASRPRDSIQSAASIPDEEETSFVTESYTESHRHSLGGESEAGQSHVSEEDNARHTAPTDDGGDSSSHHEHEDDVFSDNSPRSSMGSMSEAENKNAGKISPHKTRSARISDIPQSDMDDDFIPTLRGTPRPAFRSPSSVKAMQMSSPPASVNGTPRSSRRTPRSTVSRLGSPSVSAQYSPKKTPPRFKRNTPPLVLLHVTVLPSRWAWGHVLDNAQLSELSPEAKALWEAWNQIQDRTGDTISDRGILLPHPQNDYEVLEERLLETLELPMRRRARILECGHYLGPSNEMSLPEEIESEDEDYYDGARSPRQSMTEQTHWCKTCHSDIRYDSLGDAKVYRVKVYASNGLMRAGAWEACWKEMERVDVELEPIIDSKLQEELSRLSIEQERALELEEEAAAAAAAAVDEEIQRREEAEQAEQAEQDEQAAEAEQSYMPEQMDASVHMESSPQPDIPVESSPPYDDTRRMREEERLREIYGASPPSHPESSSMPEPRHSDFETRETPASPSVEAFERREERRESRQHAYKSASLPELIFEAVKVLMQDQKNLLIALLSLVVLVLAVRGGSAPDEARLQAVVPESFAPVAQVPEVAVEKPVEPVMDVPKNVIPEPIVEVAIEDPVESAADTPKAVEPEATQKPIQEPPQEPIEEPIQEPMQEPMQEPVQEAAYTEEHPRFATTESVHESAATEAADPCVRCSRALEDAELSLMTAPVSTIEIVKTVTETAVETVTVQALPTEAAKSFLDVVHNAEATDMEAESERIREMEGRVELEGGLDEAN